MSFKRKLITAATSALAVATFATFTVAQDTNTTSDSDAVQQKQEMRQRNRGFGGKRGFGGRGMRGGKHGGDRMLMRSLGQLNLTDAQKTQIQTISENFKSSNQPQREEMRSLMMKKRDGIMTADEQARFAELKTQAKASGTQFRDSVMAVLTVEQKAQLEQIKLERKQRWEERRQKRQNQTTTPEVN